MMTDSAITDQDWDRAAFMEALRRIPHPVRMFTDGVVCPWCGAIHVRVRLDEMNECEECHRGYAFGIPPWADDHTAVSWVPFPHGFWGELQLSRRMHLLAKWEPNDRLKRIYKMLYPDEENAALRQLHKAIEDPDWHKSQQKQ